METGDDRFRIISSNTEVVYVNGLLTALYILIPAILVVAMAVGAVAWAKSGLDAAPGGAGVVEKSAPASPMSSESFSAQYLDQATEVEEHIEAF